MQNFYKYKNKYPVNKSFGIYCTKNCLSAMNNVTGDFIIESLRKRLHIYRTVVFSNVDWCLLFNRLKNLAWKGFGTF